MQPASDRFLPGHQYSYSMSKDELLSRLTCELMDLQPGGCWCEVPPGVGRSTHSPRCNQLSELLLAAKFMVESDIRAAASQDSICGAPAGRVAPTWGEVACRPMPRASQG